LEALKVDHLSKKYGSLKVLRDVSFSVPVGERLAIIGPNGAGKTTLLNVLNGQIKVTTGHIHLYGKDITNYPMHRCASLGLGRSFQIMGLCYNLTVIHNTMLSIPTEQKFYQKIFWKIDSDQHVFKRTKMLLEGIGLWEKREFLVKSLSYGEQRRLELALCLASNSKLLLLDEPSNGLTIAESHVIKEMINGLEPDVTVILVAHDMDLVFGVAQRIIVLHYGEVISQGSPDEISSDKRVREIYMGTERDR